MFRMILAGLVLLLASRLANGQHLFEYKQNKIIPAVIEEPVLRALSHFPELKETTIHFVFTDRLKSSIMAARPTVGALFKNRQKRTYKVLINPAFKLGYGIESINQIPDSVMVGWLGHELGHIMDYEHKSTLQIIGMGISYSLSNNYIRKAERIADSFAVDRGMGAYLVAKKSFILDHAELPQAYIDKIAALYLSPDDIAELEATLEHGPTTDPVGRQHDKEHRAHESITETYAETLPGNG